MSDTRKDLIDKLMSFLDREGISFFEIESAPSHIYLQINLLDLEGESK